MVMHLQQSDGTELPDWIKFTPQNRMITGRAESTNSIELKIVATDLKKSSISTTFWITVKQNKAPLVVEEIPLQTAQKEVYFQYQISESIFRDDNGDKLRYYLQDFDEENMVPSWISFIESNRTLLGIPTEDHGQVKINVTCDDNRGGIASQQLYVEYKPNSDITKMIPLFIFGISPLLGIFGFIIAIAFTKMPMTEADKIMHMS
jgi:hypothetical protein